MNRLPRHQLQRKENSCAGRPLRGASLIPGNHRRGRQQWGASGVLRGALALLLLLAQCVDAVAATKYVNWDSVADTNNGNTPGTAYKTIAKANAVIGRGDVVIVAPSATTYDAFPCPAYAFSDGPGTQADATTYIGDTTAWNKVVVPGGDHFAKGCVLEGFRFTTSVNTGGGGTDYGTTYPPGEEQHSHGLHIRKSKLVAGGFFVDCQNCRLDSNEIGTDSSGATLEFNGLRAETDSLTICNNNMWLRTSNASSVTSLIWIHNEYNQEDADVNGGICGDCGVDLDTTRVDRTQFFNNHIRLKRLPTQTYGTGFKLTHFSRQRRAYFHDNYFDFIDSSNVTPGTAGSSCQAYLWRDGLSYNLVLRDTIVLRTVNAGKGGLEVIIPSSGNTTTGEPCFFNGVRGCHQDNYGKNTWRYCVFKNTTPSPLNYVQWKLLNGDSITRCLIVDSTGAATDGGGFIINGQSSGTSYVYRNTFVGIGPLGALRLEGASGGQVKIEGNIFYTRSNATGSNRFAARWKIPASGLEKPVDSDYNLFAHYSTNGNGQVMRFSRLDRSISEQFSGVGPGSNIDVTLNGVESHSKYGSPLFTDSTNVDNFNAVPISRVLTSIAYGMGRNGGTVGAYDSAAIAVDGIRPESINDLHVENVTYTSVKLGWTATGDDSLMGVAHHYEIRRAATAITNESEWQAATVCNATPSGPSSPGASDFFTEVRLGQGETWYFAVKVFDEQPNPSAISDFSVVATTLSYPAPDVEP